MTKAEREAVREYQNDLIAQGIDRTTAEVMAKTLVEYGIIRPVVY